jgi:hypothetical protein
MAGKIFISYRREDTAWFATALFLRLQPKFPDDLFMDVEGIGAGQDFARVIEKQAKARDVMLVLIGPNWLTARDESGRRRLDSPEDFVRVEAESALHLGKRVIPVLEPKTEMPRAHALPESLKDLALRNAVGLTHERFEIDVEGLVKALENALVEAEEARQKATTEATRETEEQAAKAVELQRRREQAMPSTYRWWQTGLERASSVCAVRQRLGQRFGSGFPCARAISACARKTNSWF